MTTHGNTKKIDINMDEAMIEELDRRADSIHLLIPEYCSLVLTEWLSTETESQPAG